MRRITTILAVLITVSTVWGRHIMRDEYIPMRDGVRLHTVIYEPDDTLPHPILLQRTGYGIEDKIPSSYKIYVENNYIIVMQDVRGKNFSEGTFEHIRPYIEDKQSIKDIDEASDTYDTAEWLIRNTRNNGNIGVSGCSYLGFYTMMAGLSGHPAIKAISPQAPVTDWFRGDDLHHNGAFMLEDTFGFPFWFQYINNKEVREQTKDSPADPSHIIQSNAYRDFLNMGPIRNFSALLGDSVELWNIAVNHPNMDEWWEKHSILPHLHDIKPAVMVVGGQFDAEDCYGALTTYRTILEQSPETETSLVYGPWSHGAWLWLVSLQAFGELQIEYNTKTSATNIFISKYEYPFFAYHLEGKGIKPRNSASVYVTGRNEWIEIVDGWKADKKPENTLYLGKNGKLTAKASKKRTASYISDPANPVPYHHDTTLTYRPPTYMTEIQDFASERADVATFQTEPLEDNIEIIGAIEVNLDVRISSTDADFIVKVIDVTPENGGKTTKQIMIRGDVFRGKYRKSLSDPEPFTPGQKENIRFRLNDIAHRFCKGHRIMVQVQSSWFPLVDRNPQTFCNIYECGEEAFVESQIEIFGTSSISW